MAQKQASFAVYRYSKPIFTLLITSMHIGIVTLKEILPVTKLNFGDTKYEGGSHTLGKLKCSGKSVSNYPESCRDLWRAGHSLNGFYPIRQTNKVEVVYCNFAPGK